MKQIHGIMVCALIGAAGATGMAHAQTFPGAKPVTLLVPWTAGGPTDLALRSLAEATSKPLGQRILVENKPGASGALAAQYMAQSTKPDGYTVAQLPLGVFRLPYMIKTTFDPIKDLTYILNVAGYEFATNVRGDAPWKTWAEFIAYAKANPGKITYGHAGLGTSPHIVMDELGKKLGINWVTVPFQGSAGSITALRGNQITAHAGGPPWPMVRNGDVRPLVLWGPKRSPKAPDVPTLNELYGIVSNSPWGIGAAAGMDPKVAKVLHDAFQKAIDDPSFLKTLDAVNMEAYYMSGAAYLEFAKKAYIEEKGVVERNNLKQ